MEELKKTVKPISQVKEEGGIRVVIGEANDKIEYSIGTRIKPIDDDVLWIKINLEGE